MPYTYANPPSFVKNKSEKLQKIAVDVFNRALQNGRTEQEALFAAIASVKAAEKPQNKVQKDFRTRPSHFPVRDTTDTQKAVVEAVNESKGYSEKVLPIASAFLGDNALPTGVERNVVSADFNDKNELVITFDTGERITTRAIEIEQFIEQYTQITSKRQENPISPSGLSNIEILLSGFTFNVSQLDHGFVQIADILFLKNNKELSIDYSVDIDMNITVRSNVDLTGVTLRITG